MLDRLALLPLPRLPGERVTLRAPQESDADDRLRHHGREQLTATRHPAEPGTCTWAVEYHGQCIGSAGLRVGRVIYTSLLDERGGFRGEGVRRDAELYPDGWKDFIIMGLLRSECTR